jgi:PAS domain S-box-containing protein
MNDTLDRLLQRLRGPAPGTRDEEVRALFETAPLPMGLLSAAGEIVYVNRQFLETFGYAHAEIPSLEAWWPRAYPDAAYREQVQRDWCSRLVSTTAHGEMPPYEARVTCRDGRVRTIEWRATHFGGSTLVVGTDLTDRLVASRALVASEERYRVLLEYAPEAIVVLDAESGRFVDANPAAERLFQLTRDQLLRIGPIELSPPRQRDGRLSADAAMASIQAALEGERPVFEWTHRDRDGREFPCEIRLLRLPDAAQRRILRGTIIDISERKQDEETRKRLEAQLRQAQKMEAIGTLAGGIAHDFNNILTGILGSIQLAELDLAPDDKIRPSLDRATKACLRAKDLVAKILTFSRRGEQQQSVHPLGPVVREAVGLLRASLPATIEIRTFITEQPLPILCDPGQIHQVVMNLSANAAHAMRARGGVLTIAVDSFTPDALFIAAHPQFPPGPAASCLTVTDTGTGMDAMTRERIFEPFFTTKPVGEGTGLGLAVVHGIIEDHRGAITVESEPHIGTTFRIYFTVTAPTSPARRGSSTPFAPARGAGQRVLFVDDEPDVAAVAERVLGSLGYQAVTFTRSPDALLAFQHDPNAFDAVVSDLTMPELTGADLVAEILTMRPGTPVLVMTGYMRGADQERMRALGVRHCLEKPFTVTSFASAMKDMLGQTPP